MTEHCIPFTAIPHSSRLFLDYLFDHTKVSEFYPRPANRSWLAEQARTITFDNARRGRVADVLERQNREFGSGQAAMDAIARLGKDAVAVVTGQQVGLFGGPLYSLLKAASALNAAAELNSGGVPAVAVFWLATEDHDLDEINRALLPAGPGALKGFTIPVRNHRGAPVGKVSLPADVEAIAAEAAETLGGGEIARSLQDSYKDGETYGSAFGKLFARIFREHGLILLDPLDPELHEIAKPIYVTAMGKAEELDTALLQRGKKLQDAGYHEQVKVTGESTLLFSLEGGQRTVIHRANGGFMIGAEKIAREDLLRRVGEHPENFSPNVLLRPVVQDYLLPTVTYFGGAAEVAYFAQAAVVYEKLLGRVTPILPRLSATVVNARMRKLLTRYQLTLLDLFDGAEKLKELLGSRAMPEKMRDTLDVATAAVEENIAAMQEAFKVIDPTLIPAAEKAARKMKYQIERLRRRGAQAELRRDQQLERDAAELIAGLYPEKTLQERELAGIALLAANGMGLLDRLLEAAKEDCGAHQVIYL